jgi:hypothetical protein
MTDAINCRSLTFSFGVGTLIDVLPFIEWFEHKLVGESAESVNEMSAQVRVDVLRQELG